MSAEVGGVLFHEPGKGLKYRDPRGRVTLLAGDEGGIAEKTRRRIVEELLDEARRYAAGRGGSNAMALFVETARHVARGILEHRRRIF